MLIIIVALVIGVPILIILTSIFIIVITYCCCQKNGTVEDELPKSLIENCRRAEPPPEEQGKYLPELFDVSAFHFKGPLIIECPKLHILEHDLTNAKPARCNMKDHVRFDENLNVAYNIGENVEIIVKSYGKGTKTGNGERIKESEAGEDDEKKEQENLSGQSTIENGGKEIAKQPSRQNIELQEKRSAVREVLDSERKSKSVACLDFTQPSRYSESSTQTLRVNGEANVKNPKKQSGEIDIRNRREGNFSAGYDASKRGNEPFRERAPNILSKQTAQAPTTSMIMIRKGQQTTSSTGITNIMPTMQAVKSHRWVPKEINPSTSGSAGGN